MKGGSFKDYNEKTYLPLSDAQIEKHLRGEQFIGIYPLLPDNTSWFLAADFDDQGWEEACRRWASSLRVFVCQNFRILSIFGGRGHQRSLNVCGLVISKMKN